MDKKKWNEAEVNNLEIKETENGLAPSDDFDDTWVQVDGLWYRPGNGDENLNSGNEN